MSTPVGATKHKSGEFDLEGRIDAGSCEAQDCRKCTLICTSFVNKEQQSRPRTRRAQRLERRPVRRVKLEAALKVRGGLVGTAGRLADAREQKKAGGAARHRVQRAAVRRERATKGAVRAERHLGVNVALLHESGYSTSEREMGREGLGALGSVRVAATTAMSRCRCLNVQTLRQREAASLVCTTSTTAAAAAGTAGAGPRHHARGEHVRGLARAAAGNQRAREQQSRLVARGPLGHQTLGKEDGADRVEVDEGALDARA
jgi:hypothetical protein